MAQNQLPAYLQQYQAPDIAGSLSATLGSTMPPHVSIGGQRFTLIDAGNNEIPVPTFDPQLGVYLDACIVDVNEKMSRIYFAGAYDSNAEGVRPDCFSDNGIAPSISANSPQAPSCQPDPTGVNGCPWAVWGSKISPQGKKIPACSSKQKIALLVPGFQTLFLLAVPPNSHGPLREYVEKCKGNGINMANLITRISFVAGIQGTLQFQAVSYIDEALAQIRQAAYAEKKTDALVGRNDVPRITGAIASVRVASSLPAENPTVQQQPVQQIAQQPDPRFGGQAGAAPFGGAASTAEHPSTNTVQPLTPHGASAASPSEPAPAPRKRRRTAAEMQAANGAPPNGQAPQQPSSPAQAPFPHPGQATSGEPATFGIAQGQPAAANPELASMLDDFFGK